MSNLIDLLDDDFDFVEEIPGSNSDDDNHVTGGDVPLAATEENDPTKGVTDQTAPEKSTIAGTVSSSTESVTDVVQGPSTTTKVEGTTDITAADKPAGTTENARAPTKIEKKGTEAGSIAETAGEAVGGTDTATPASVEGKPLKRMVSQFDKKPDETKPPRLDTASNGASNQEEAPPPTWGKSRECWDPEISNQFKKGAAPGPRGDHNDANDDANGSGKCSMKVPAPSESRLKLERLKQRTKEAKLDEGSARRDQKETHSGLYITDRCMSQEKFDRCMTGKTFVPLRDVKKLAAVVKNYTSSSSSAATSGSMGPNLVSMQLNSKQDHVIIACGIQYVQTLKVGGSVCSEWQISDLPTNIHPQATVSKIRLIDQAFVGWSGTSPSSMEAWSECKKGSVFAFLNPYVTVYNGNVVSKVRFAAQIVKLGECADIGFCKVPQEKNPREICGHPIDTTTNRDGCCKYHRDKKYHQRCISTRQPMANVGNDTKFGKLRAKVMGSGSSSSSSYLTGGTRTDGAMGSTRPKSKNVEETLMAIGKDVKKGTKATEERKKAEKALQAEKDAWWAERKRMQHNTDEVYITSRLEGKSMLQSLQSNVPLIGRGSVKTEEDKQVIMFDDDDMGLTKKTSVAVKNQSDNAMMERFRERKRRKMEQEQAKKDGVAPGVKVENLKAEPGSEPRSSSASGANSESATTSVKPEAGAK